MNNFRRMLGGLKFAVSMAIAITVVATITISATAADESVSMIVIVGAEGTPEFGSQFREWSERWKKAADVSKSRLALVGNAAGEKPDRELLRDHLAQTKDDGGAPLWVVYIGHGTYDGKSARLNLRGPDVTAKELGEWLRAISRPVVFIDCSSSSGPFLSELSGPNRFIVTATKSGSEHNFSRFGGYMSAAIVDPAADLDKDDQVSLLEAFLLAAARTREWYQNESRLATEHALIDDNGDRLGTPSEWFKGVRAVKVAKNGASPDGAAASQLVLIRSVGEQLLSPEQRVQREKLEQQINALRKKKSQISEDDYYSQLEMLSVELARLYEGAEKASNISPPMTDSK